MPSRRSLHIGLALTAGAALLDALPATASQSRASGASSNQQQQTCPVLGMDPDSVTLSGPAGLWPPNHQAATFDGGPRMCSSRDPGHMPFVVTVPHDRRR